MDKKLIIPVVTPAWIPPEDKLPQVLETGRMVYHGAESESWESPMIEGVPQEFHDACQRLLQSFSGRASAVVFAGTTGEGTVLWPEQYKALLRAMKKALPKNIIAYAGVIASDDRVSDQIWFAASIGIDHVLLGINHTRQSEQRLQDALWALSPAGRIFLYNLPTFRPASQDLILQCLQDERIAGIKDSSGDTEFFRWLLSLKKERPDFQVFHGNEQLYGELSPEEYTDVDGLVAGNANVHPALLHAYTNNPQHDAHQHGRQTLHERVIGLSGRPQTDAVRTIEGHIHGLKRRLTQLRVIPDDESPHTLLQHGQDALYSYKPGSLFQGL